MKPSHIEHIGIAVPNLDEAIRYWEDVMGLECYNIEEVVDVIEMLADSQGFYGRLLEEILYIEENDPLKYEIFKNVIERQEFKNPVEVMMFFEG